MENNNSKDQENVKTKENVKTEEVKKIEKKDKEKSKNGKKLRNILVLLFLVLFCVVSYIELRGSYLEYLELGEKYISVFKTNLIYRYGIMGICFAILYFTIYFTNRGIKKGLKPFFEREKKELPKLPNKSLALVISAIVSFIVSASLTQKIMLIVNGTSFAIQDPIFGLDISYYIFQKPVIETFVIYFIILLLFI